MNIFTVKTSLDAKEKGMLQEWINNFLNSEGGNRGLLEGLKIKKRYWRGPYEINIDKLKRCCGPEKDMEYLVSKETFEKNVNCIKEIFDKKGELPPLIDEYVDGLLIVRDGNHRLEALRRCGIKKYWVLVWHNNINDFIESNNLKPAIIFITGTSGAGKSTLKESLEKLNTFSIKTHDFDEWGVPKGADEIWRKETTTKWVEYCLRNLEEEKCTVIFGQSVPNEIDDVIKAKGKENLPLYFGFIDIEEKTIRDRLRKIGMDDNGIQANVNWAAYLKRETLEQKNHIILDGENKSKEDVANFFEEWILSIIVKD